MKSRWLVATLLAVALTFSSGCALLLVGAAAGAGAGGYAYVNGELKETDAVTLDAAYAATLAAMHDMQYAVVSKPKDAVSATITGRTATDKKIEVDLDKESASTTQIGIRVGTFGDESVSRQLLNKIKSHY